VKSQLRPRNFSTRSVSRRKFYGKRRRRQSVLSIVPRRVLGGVGYVPPSDKVNIAFVGVGSRAARNASLFWGSPMVQGVAVCDPNKSSANYPQWEDT